jgi:hypothetical protein
MGNRFQVCSICSAPADVRAAVNEALARREKFLDLAARTGFSKSALHRHSQRCVPREILSRYKNQRTPPAPERELVRWPDGRIFVWRTQQPVAPDEVRPNDIVFSVAYNRTAKLPQKIEESKKEQVSRL